ncbi:MAG: hypothetical protein CMN65_03660 [Sphingomonadaceae bacterium]|nr:hypothetical protein [Sphingomonadaceae bacterium]
MRSLGRNADQWNEFADTKEVRSHVERTYRRQVERDLLPRLKNSQLRALLFIGSRTVGWQKFAEAIPKTHFQRGLVDEEKSALLDERGVTLCAGAGLSKEETIRSACNSLARQGIITIFPGRPGTLQPAHVFMPFSEASLARLLIEAGSKVLPRCAPIVVPGEHLFARDAVWRVLDVRDSRLSCVEMERKNQEGERAELDVSECRRMSLASWEQFEKI